MEESGTLAHNLVTDVSMPFLTTKCKDHNNRRYCGRRQESIVRGSVCVESSIIGYVFSYRKKQPGSTFWDRQS